MLWQGRLRQAAPEPLVLEFGLSFDWDNCLSQREGNDDEEGGGRQIFQREVSRILVQRRPLSAFR